MKVELKAVKYAAFASEETYCFTAQVWIDSVKRGTARNDGHGGMTFVEPRELREALDAHGRTLPPIKLGHDLGDLAVDAEVLVNELMSDWLLARDLKRAISRGVVFVKGGVLWTRKAPRNGDVSVLAKHTAAEPGVTNVLNLMAETDALALYKRLAKAG